jgi:hypothetical protein
LKGAKMSTKIAYPKEKQVVSNIGFTAYGTTKSAQESKRIRGIIIGTGRNKGMTYVGVPLPLIAPTNPTWGLAFFDPYGKTMVTDHYVLFVFDFLRPLKVLRKVSFYVRSRIVRNLTNPLTNATIQSTFYASGNTTLTQAEIAMLHGTMTDKNGVKYSNLKTSIQPGGSYSMAFSIPGPSYANPFTLDVWDPTVETASNITVQS